MEGWYCINANYLNQCMKHCTQTKGKTQMTLFIPKGGGESAGEEGIPCFQGEGIFAETNKERERL